MMTDFCAVLLYLPLWDEWIEIVPICLIIDENHIAQITPVQVLPFIMRQVHYMDDSEMAGKTLELLNRLMTEVKLYRLECDFCKNRFMLHRDVYIC